MADSKSFLSYEGLQKYDDHIKRHVNDAIENQKSPLPSVTTDDAGKFLRVSSDGLWAAENIPNAEEATF